MCSIEHNPHEGFIHAKSSVHGNIPSIIVRMWTRFTMFIILFLASCFWVGWKSVIFISLLFIEPHPEERIKPQPCQVVGVCWTRMASWARPTVVRHKTKQTPNRTSLTSFESSVKEVTFYRNEFRAQFIFPHFALAVRSHKGFSVRWSHLPQVGKQPLRGTVLMVVY